MLRHKMKETKQLRPQSNKLFSSIKTVIRSCVLGSGGEFEPIKIANPFSQRSRFANKSLLNSKESFTDLFTLLGSWIQPVTGLASTRVGADVVGAKRVLRTWIP